MFNELRTDNNHSLELANKRKLLTYFDVSIILSLTLPYEMSLAVY